VTAVALAADWWTGADIRNHTQQHENEAVNDNLRVRH